MLVSGDENQESSFFKHAQLCKKTKQNQNDNNPNILKWFKFQ